MDYLNAHYRNSADLLIKEQNPNGFWKGKLSSSALATAVSIVTLKINGSLEHHKNIEQGLNWLSANMNEDGGYGDTPESISNVSTSLLCYAAIYYCLPQNSAALKKIEAYLQTQNINLKPEEITASILNFYGSDYTFSVPILSMLVICGIMEEKCCRVIPQLPFEFVLLPTSWYSFFNLRVVSYALPALIAMGIFIFTKREKHNPLMRIIRKKSIKPSLRKLEEILPASGGFLEATPLTGFVSMCLISSGYQNHTVVKKGVNFLLEQQREDGSWPIDTDLSTWVTTLSVKAFGKDIKRYLESNSIRKLRKHLLSLQYQTKHSFNDSQPGGWGWTDYSGSVPDVDDTCGAILALLELYEESEEESTAIIQGCLWLLAQQNNDGGFPTFCKGWGRLPFDSSCSDLTGHAFLALLRTIKELGIKLPDKLALHFYKSAARGLEFLKRKQREDGSWLPLWFGNQFTQDKANPVYGTAKVSIYLKDCLLYSAIDVKLKSELEQMLLKAGKYLINQQNSDGSWGGSKGAPGSVEETALALSALSIYSEESRKAFEWLTSIIETKGFFSSPIGLYFAALWYDEKLYPLIYYVEAVRRYQSLLKSNA